MQTGTFRVQDDSRYTDIPDEVADTTVPLLIYRDGHLAASVPLFEVSDGIRRLAQWVRAVDDGFELSGFHELAKKSEIALTGFSDERGELPARQGRRDHGQHQSDHQVACCLIG